MDANMSGKCQACDVTLDDFEMTRKYLGTTEYVGLCNHCWYNSQMYMELGVEERDDFQKQLSYREDALSDLREEWEGYK